MNRTKIEWTDWTWNPVTGCLHGCPYCYARAIYHRFHRDFTPRFHPEKLREPFAVKSPARIFVGSVSDLLGSWFEPQTIQQVIEVVRRLPQHTFQFLSKNPERYRDFDWPPNAWLGATATNLQQMARAAIGLADSNRVTFVSCEPLLEKVDLKELRPSWVIIGAQTGRGARQPEREWIESLITEGRACGAAVFTKPNLIGINPLREFPQDIPRTILA